MLVKSLRPGHLPTEGARKKVYYLCIHIHMETAERGSTKNQQWTRDIWMQPSEEVINKLVSPPLLFYFTSSCRKKISRRPKQACRKDQIL